jgi:hypothetical protein
MNLKVLPTALAGFVTMFITNGLMAAVVIGPLFESRYESIVANPANFPLLILGYLIIAVAMALLYPRLQPGGSWLSHSLQVGVFFGLAVFLGTHTVISGYTTIDATGFILSGMFDSVGPMVGMVAIGYAHHRSQQD